MKSKDYDKIYSEQWASIDKGTFIGPRKKLVLSIFPINRGRNLDIGCGNGDFMSEISKEKVKIEGIDFSKEAISIAKKRMLKVKLMDSLNLKYPKNTFSVVTAIDVLEHIKNQEKAIKEWSRVLKIGGTMIICVPFNKKLWGEDDNQVGHYRRYELKDFQKLFKGKLKIENVLYYGFPFYLILRKFKLKFGKKNKLTTGCFARNISRKSSLFILLVKLINSIEFLFKKFPLGTAMIVKVKKIS